MSFKFFWEAFLGGLGLLAVAAWAVLNLPLLAAYLAGAWTAFAAFLAVLNFWEEPQQMNEAKT